MITPLNIGIYGRKYFGPEPEYKAVLDKAFVLGYALPLHSEQIQQNEMVKAMKLSGIWSRLDQFYNFYYTGSINFSLINWINPSIVLTKDSLAYFLNKEGVRVDIGGSTTPLISSFNSSASSGKYQLGDASFGYVNGYSDGTSNDFGNVSSNSSGSVQTRFRQNLATPRLYFQQNGGFTAVGGMPTNKSNLFIIANRNGTNLKLVSDNVTKLNATVALSSVDVNYNFNFLALPSPNGETIRLGFTGGKLTDTQISDFFTIWNNYKNSI